MKKLLLMMLVLMGGINSVSAKDVLITGNFCSWSTSSDYVLLSGDKMRGRLDITDDIIFKLVEVVDEGTYWKGYSDIDFDAPTGVITDTGDNGNIQLNASVLGTGTYRFTGTYNSSTSRWTLKIEKGSSSSYTVYYVNGTSLSNVYVFTFNDGECGAWPGTEMTKSGTYSVNGDDFDVYSYTFNALFAPENVIFNNNNGFQTQDLTFINGKTYGYYNYSVVGEGDIFSYDWDSDGSTNFMKANGDGTYTFSANNKELVAQTINLKVIKREGSNVTWQGDPNTELNIPADGYYNISITSNSDMSSVTAIATRITATASAGTYGMATFSSAYPLDFTGITAVSAYTITAASNGNLTKTQVTGKVPANTGLYIEGDVDASADVPTTIYTGSVGTNMLVAAASGTKIYQEDGDYTNYILTVKTIGGYVDTPKFYRVNGTSGNNVSAGKAYLQIPTASAAREILWFDDEVTAIENLTPALNKVEGVVFDLQGRRVMNPTKGLYIVNGKKTIIK